MAKKESAKKEPVKEIPAEEKAPEEEHIEVVEKDVITDIPEVEAETKPAVKTNIDSWKPKTALGKKVKNGEITSIDAVLNLGIPILEEQIVDMLIPEIQTELLMIGQSKGKFGGGSRRIFKQTQKKTPEGNKPSFSCIAVVGNGNGYVGIGLGKSKDTVPAREKAIRSAKLALFKVRRGAGSWEDATSEPHSIPWKSEGKSGAVRLTLFPAPKGKGLVLEKECAKILKLAGIENVYSKSRGDSHSKMNLVYACKQALENLNAFRTHQKDIQKVFMIEGRKK